MKYLFVGKLQHSLVESAHQNGVSTLFVRLILHMVRIEQFLK